MFMRGMCCQESHHRCPAYSRSGVCFMEKPDPRQTGPVEVITGLMEDVHRNMVGFSLHLDRIEGATNTLTDGSPPFSPGLYVALLRSTVFAHGIAGPYAKQNPQQRAASRTADFATDMTKHDVNVFVSKDRCDLVVRTGSAYKTPENANLIVLIDKRIDRGIILYTGSSATGARHGARPRGG